MKFRMLLVNLALRAIKIFAPMYTERYPDRIGQKCYVVENRILNLKYPFSDKEYVDHRTTYMTEDFRFFTLSDVVFFKYHVKILNNTKREVKK